MSSMYQEKEDFREDVLPSLLTGTPNAGCSSVNNNEDSPSYFAYGSCPGDTDEVDGNVNIEVPSYHINGNYLKSLYDRRDSKTTTESYPSICICDVHVSVELIPDNVIPERILCLDGGGVKGIVEAITLKYFHYAMKRHHECGSGRTVAEDLTDLIKKDNEILLKKNECNDDSDGIECDQSTYGTDFTTPTFASLGAQEDLTPHLHQMFDIITGTSTGSIIASAIARLHWNPDQLIKTSKEIAPLVFPKPSKWNLLAKMKNSIVSGLALCSNKFYRYSAKAFEEYLQKHLGDVTWEQKNKKEPIFGIVAIREENAQVHVFDSDIYSNSKTVTVRQAVRASTAAPTYFPSCEIKDDISKHNNGKEEMKTSTFVDGGLSANCPANYTMAMMRNSNYNLGCLLSIGCGDGEPKRMPCTRVLQIAMNNKECWESFHKSHPRDQDNMFRLIPDAKAGIGSYDLADSDRVDEMENSYITSLQNNKEAVENFQKASSHLFAKSIHLLKIQCEKIESKHHLHLDVKTMYNDKQYRYTGDVLRDNQLEEVKIPRNRDGLPSLVLQAYFDIENDVIKFSYEGQVIVGSPVRVVRKMKYTNRRNSK